MRTISPTSTGDYVVKSSLARVHDLRHLSHLHLARRGEKKEEKELYDFQKECIANIYQFIKDNETRILLIAACATGKTTMAAQIIKDATVNSVTPTRCLFLVSLNCLLDQTANTLQEMGVSCSVLQGDRAFDSSVNAVVASIQTIRSRLKRASLDEILGRFGIIFNDEAHWSSYDKVYAKIYEHYAKTGTVFIGLTATPWRTSRKQYLGQWFDKTVEAPQPPELVKLGKLVPCRTFGFGKTFDFSKLDIGADGDYKVGQIEAQATGKATLECVVREYLRLASGRRAAAFCVSRKHAELLCSAFLAKGVPSEYLDGETPFEQREAMFERLDAGITMVLCSVGTLHAGWNSRPTSCIIVARPTRSKALFFQISGRGGRTYEGKTDYYILDFGNNVVTHGSPMGFQNYDIGPNPLNLFANAFKECPQCHLTVPNWARVCECGFVFEKPPEVYLPKEEREIDAELVEILSPEDRAKAKFLRTALKEAFKKRICPDAAIREFIKAYGHVPPSEWYLHAVLGRRYSAKKRADFEAYLQHFAPHDLWYRVRLRWEFGTDGYQAKTPRTEPQISFEAPWYQVLGVVPNASVDEVKAAYRQLVRQYHPDVCAAPDAGEKVKAINNAFHKYESLYLNKKGTGNREQGTGRNSSLFTVLST